MECVFASTSGFTHDLCFLGTDLGISRRSIDVCMALHLAMQDLAVAHLSVVYVVDDPA